MSGAEAKRLVWVTGARGFIGRNVCRYFHANGWNVAGLGRGRWDDPEAWGVDTWVEAEVDRSSLKALHELTGPPLAVFHGAATSTITASYEDPERARADTVGSAETLIMFLRSLPRAPVVVYPSSCAVYGDTDELPIRETALRRPVSPYGRDKAAAEDLLLDAARDGVLKAGIVRYFSVYGAGLRKQLLWDVAHRVAAGERTLRLGGTGNETRDFIHIKDAVSLAMTVTDHLISSRAPSTIVNGATGRGTTVGDAVRELTGHLDDSVAVHFDGEVRAGNPEHYVGAIEEARALGYDPRLSVRDGIAEYARWFTESGESPLT